MIRLFDISFSILGLMLLIPVMIFLFFLKEVFNADISFFVQERIGKNKLPFNIIKLRTMSIDAPNEASHKVSVNYITPAGRVLRKTKLDELPQLWNVLVGDMSLVGPRPCLPIQKELIKEREKKGVFTVRPGITGLSQINAIDMSDPKIISEIDAKMVSSMNLRLYFYCIFRTITGSGFGDKTKREQ